MKIDLERLCRLAGLKGKSAESLNEASNRSMHDDPALDAEREMQHSNQLNEDEVAVHEEAMDAYEAEEAQMEDEDAEETEEVMGEEMNLDEVIEVDEAMLVQELRRARKMISEAKAEEAKGDLTEAQLRKIIAAEVATAMKDFNLTSGWVYGDEKPTNSKRGQVITSMPGLGFKNSNVGFKN